MKMSWVLYSIIAMLSLAFMVLAVKKASDLGAGSKIINLYIFGIVFLGFLAWNLTSGENVKIDKTVFLFLLVAAVFSFIGNFLMFSAVGKAANPGYVVAIVGLHGALVTLLSLFIFKSAFTAMKLAGVILAVISIILISI